MRRTLVAVVLLLMCSPLAAQVRVDVGLAAGLQPFEAQDIDPSTLISPEVFLSRGRLSLYYALDGADIGSGGNMYGSHLGLAFRWPVTARLSLLAGAGPSYVSIASLGGEPTWHAQVELAFRSGRLEWFARARHYDYRLSEFRVADISPDGPALLGGVRVMLRR